MRQDHPFESRSQVSQNDPTGAEINPKRPRMVVARVGAGGKPKELLETAGVVDVGYHEQVGPCGAWGMCERGGIGRRARFRF